MNLEIRKFACAQEYSPTMHCLTAVGTSLNAEGYASPFRYGEQANRVETHLHCNAAIAQSVLREA